MTTHTIYQYENGSGTEVGTHDLPEWTTTKDIVDAVEQINSGQDADAVHDGTDPYDGDLVQTLDGWLVITSNGEGDLSLIHAKREE